MKTILQLFIMLYNVHMVQTDEGEYLPTNMSQFVKYILEGVPTDKVLYIDTVSMNK